MKKQTRRLKNRARRLKNWILTGVVATLSQLLSATTPFGALGAVEKKCYAGIFESSG